MIDKITKLASMGYSAKSILDSLLKKSPDLAKRAGKALALGYAPATILSRLVSDQKAKPETYRTELEQYFRGQEQQRTRGLGQLATAATAIGAAGLGLGRVAGLLGTEKAAEKLPEVAEGIKTVAEKLPEIPKKESLIEKERARFEAPEAPVEKPSILKESLKDIGETKLEKDFPHLKNFVEKLLKAGKKPEEVYESLTKSGMYKGLVKAFEEKNQVSYMQRIKEIMDEIVSSEREKFKPKAKKDLLERAREQQVKLSGKQQDINALLDSIERDLGL